MNKSQSKTAEIEPVYTAEDEQVLTDFLKSAVNNTPDEVSPAESISPVTPFIFNRMNGNFNVNAVKYLGKKDTVFISPDVFMSVSVHIEAKDSLIYASDGVHQPFTVDVTSAGQMVVCKVNRLSYGVSDEQKASALSGFKRYTESTDTLYAEVYRDETGMLKVNRLLQWDRSEKQFYTSDLFGGALLTEDDKTAIAGRINTYLMRVSNNRDMRDERFTTDAKGKKIGIGKFGALKRQQKNAKGK